MKFVALTASLLLLDSLTASGHIGNPTTIHEGLAGNAPVRVSVRVPSVVPGLAEINVRVLTNGATRVTALPVHWRTGIKGAPPPDVCEPVAGEPDLYHAELWLMERGAFSVDVAVETANGSGKVSVPINALATTRLPMTRFLGGLLAVLGVLLFALAATAVGAAMRESVLEPGLAVSRKRAWVGRAGPSLPRAFSRCHSTEAGAGGKTWIAITATTGCTNRCRPARKHAPRMAGACCGSR